MKQSWWVILTLGVIFLLFFIKGVVFLDPDWGWQLKFGERVLESGIPQTDPFSYTMPSYPMINHEWLGGVIFFKIYQLVGNWGISFILALLSILALFLALPQKKDKLSIIPLILGGGFLFVIFGIKAQVIGWVFFSLLLKILLDQKIYLKFRWLLPIMFLGWVNLHGSFALGVLFLGGFLIYKGVILKKIQTGEILIFLLCLLVTLLNPYGLRIWEEVKRTVFDSNLRWQVVEWYPGLFSLDLTFWALLMLGTMIIIYERKLFNLFWQFSFVILAVMGLSSQRHIALWIFIAIPTIVLGLEEFRKKIKTDQIAVRRFNWTIIGGIIIASVLAGLNIIPFFSNTDYREENYYPKEAVNFLKQNPKTGNIFAPYAWGGYLIWEYPDKKVFIDGRMPTWKQAKKEGEAGDVMDEYNQIILGKSDFNQLADKYQINQVMWYAPKTEEANILERLRVTLFPSWAFKNPSLVYLPSELLTKGWKVGYKDQTTIIMMRE